jgi:hypothetical protein
MKVEVLNTCYLFPKTKGSGEQRVLLPVIDAWYAYVRTSVPLLFFDKSPPSEELIEAFARNLDSFSFFAGIIEPHTAQDGKQRARLVWGRSNDPGAEVIEARTGSELRSLMPPVEASAIADRSFLWDRSSASPTGLFPRTPTKSLVRIQITTFKCGGCTVGFDFDHSLADAHTIGNFLYSWSILYSQKHPALTKSPQTKSQDLPEIVLLPNYLQDAIRECSSDGDAMRLRASQLPTRRPDLRVVSDTKKVPSSNGGAPPSTFSLMGKASYMLQISPHRYEQLIRRVKDEASLSVTDHSACGGLLWAALNRARLATGREAIGLHFVLSLREPLELPAGQVGSPALAIMVDTDAGDDSDSTNSGKLASRITKMLDTYDQDAIRAVIYDATCRDSPTDGRRSRPAGEVMTFTSGVQCDMSRLSFGAHRPVFFAPWVMPLDNFFAVMGGLTPHADHGSQKPSQNGVTIFFRLPVEVAEAMATDPVFDGFEHFSPM